MSHVSPRKIRRAIEKAGGRIVNSRGAHLRVAGPAGVAFVGTELRAARAARNTEAALRRYAGLDVDLGGVA